MSFINLKNIRWFAGASLAVLVFFLSENFVFGPLHEEMFLAHTSIQNNVESCVGTGQSLECQSEDAVRAYTGRGWAILGNTVALVFVAARVLISFAAFHIVRGRVRQTNATNTVHDVSAKGQVVMFRKWRFERTARAFLRDHFQYELPSWQKPIFTSACQSTLAAGFDPGDAAIQFLEAICYGLSWPLSDENRYFVSHKSNCIVVAVNGKRVAPQNFIRAVRLRFFALGVPERKLGEVERLFEESMQLGVSMMKAGSRPNSEELFISLEDEVYRRGLVERVGT